MRSHWTLLKQQIKCRSPLNYNYYSMSTVTTTVSPRNNYNNNNNKKETQDTNNPKTIWRQWFQSHEYQSIYNPSPFQDKKNQIQPLVNHPSLDKQSRNMIQRLQDMCLKPTTIISTLDIATTQQCNYMIAYKLSDPQIRKHVQGLSHRAYMIWKKMEYCHEVRTDLHKNNTTTTTITKHTKTTHPSFTTPKPNRDTYLSVLKLHSLETHDPNAPERAYEIIQFMNQRHEQDPSWDTQPSSLIWNQCISSWANTTREDKAYHVANLIFNIIDKQYLDISSYGHAFKACATCQTPRGKELARNVLLRLWKHLQKNEHVLPSIHTMTNPIQSRGSLTFVHLIHALQHVTDENVKEETIQDVLHTVQTYGWMNAHVIKAYGSLISKERMEETFGIYAKGSEGIQTDNKYGHIYQNIPKQWKRNCKVNKFGW